MAKFIKGLQGVIASQSSISYILGEKGKLVYRGYNIKDLAAKSSFEEVIYLLWEGNLPKKSEFSSFKRKLYKCMSLPSPVKKLISSIPKKEVPISSVRTAVSLLSAYDKDAEDMSPEANKRKAIRIMAQMASVVAAVQRVRDGKKILSPKKGLSIAANFLYMLKGKVPSKYDEKVMDVALILHAEHGLNASTFSSQVTVATLADMYSGMVSAIGTLKGPLHGGANVKAIESFFNLSKKLHIQESGAKGVLGKIDKYVEGLLAHHIRIMGIGHRVYRVKDPRAIILEEYAKKEGSKYHKYYEIAKEIEKVMAEEKHMYPNVDFYSGIVYEDLGIKPELYVCLFVLSRTAGWIAHMLEQYSDNRLIRPRQEYVGVSDRKYVKK